MDGLNEALSLKENVSLRGIEEGDGCWVSCSGCHETNEGYETGWYPYSPTFRCYLGSGCRECGGLGAIWDNTDYDDMANYLAEEADLTKDAGRGEEQPDLPEAFSEPGCAHVWFGVDGCGKAWSRIDTIMDGAETASYAVLPEVHQAALTEARSLLREGCDLLADEHESLKCSITMPDGTLSANPLDAWSVEKVQSMDDWILRAGRAALGKDSTS